MDSSMCMGFMAVFAVSGSVALLALQLHHRLLSDFMKKIDFEFGNEKCHRKKRVRFTENAIEPSLTESEKEYNETNLDKTCSNRSYNGLEGVMPLNRVVLYKGIIEQKMLFPKKDYGVSLGRNILYHNDY